jgi:hypothetical protein
MSGHTVKDIDEQRRCKEEERVWGALYAPAQLERRVGLRFNVFKVQRRR